MGVAAHERLDRELLGVGPLAGVEQVARAHDQRGGDRGVEVGGGGLGYWLGGKRHTSVATARTFGVGATWGAITFAFMTDAVGGSNVSTTHHDVFLGAGLGTGLGAAAGLLGP